MTTPVCVRQRIRQLDRQGLSHKEISRKLGVSRTTVVKYANHGDYSPRPSNAVRPGRSLVDAGYAAIVDGWPTADLRMPVKQRHTATRVYERLVAECGFTGSYSSVRRWVKRWRREHRMESDGFAELKWAPGSAQVDFGQARAVIAGVERVAHFLVVSFPYSNMRWVVALPGETSECVCQGLLWIFERMGRAPRVVVFDNATGVGHRRPDGTAARTRLFSLFCAHYGFEPRFRDPYSGHGKGSVENAVGFVRRNLMVPRPSAESFQTLTRVWLDACERVAGSDHYRHDVPVIELFEAEKDHMLPLPGVRFDPCDWRSVKADKTGAVTIDANRYLAGPKWRSMRLQAGVRVFEIELRAPTAKRSPRWRGFGAIRRKPRWIRRACSRSSRESRVYGAKARSGTISPKPCEPCSTTWTHARAPICSTTSEPLPPTAGSPPRSKRWKPSSTRDGPSTVRRSAHVPNASSRVREPKAGRI